MKKTYSAPLTVGIAASLAFALGGCSSEAADPFRAAQAAVAKHDHAAARILLLKALDADPGNTQARLMSGEVALELGDAERAITDLKMLVDDKTLGMKVRPLLAQAYLLNGKSRLALETLGPSGPSDGKGFAIAVKARSLAGQQDMALATLKEGLKRFPNSIDLMVLDATRAIAYGEIDLAKRISAAVTKAAPDNIDGILFAGQLAMALKDSHAAGAYFKHAVELRPSDITAMLALAALANDKGDKKAAKEWLDKLRAIAPGNPVGGYFAAQMAYDAGKIDDAIKIIQSLGGNAEAFPALTMLSGTIDAQKGQYELAITKLRKFFSNGGEDGRARFALAYAQAKVGDNKSAWKTLEPLAKAQNATPLILVFAAKLTGDLGDPAHELYKQRVAKASQPDPIGTEMVAANTAIEAGDWKKADAIYQGLINSGKGNSAIVLNNAANARLQLGDTAGAVALARRALVLAPDDPIILDTLGWALFKAEGKSNEAIELLRKAVTAMPGNEDIRGHWIALASSK